MNIFIYNRYTECPRFKQEKNILYTIYELSKVKKPVPTGRQASGFVIFSGNYSSIEIASTGQTSAQEPQSVQSSGSIT